MCAKKADTNAKYNRQKVQDYLLQVFFGCSQLVTGCIVLLKDQLMARWNVLNLLPS